MFDVTLLVCVFQIMLDGMMTPRYFPVSTDSMLYLGVIIPSNMTWNTHITNVTSNIESVDTGKYLGVIIPSNMTWNTHIDHVGWDDDSKIFSCIY
jgi:hypothetical protein